VKAIIWISVAGLVFWWMMIDRPGRETTYRGTRYFFSRLAAAVGLQPHPRKVDETAATVEKSRPEEIKPPKPVRTRRQSKKRLHSQEESDQSPEQDLEPQPEPQP